MGLKFCNLNAHLPRAELFVKGEVKIFSKYEADTRTRN